MSVITECPVCGSDGPYYRVGEAWLCETCVDRIPDALERIVEAD